MKVKNKVTGEINILKIDEDYFKIYQDDGDFVCPVTLKELSDGWEDYYEEPKEYWYIDDAGVIQIDQALASEINMRKSIGNYFETKEDAEKAVEKLKAWKRLKDTYFIRFNLDFVKNTISFTYRIDDTLHSVVNEERIVFEDMKTIFGGGE